MKAMIKLMSLVLVLGALFTSVGSAQAAAEDNDKPIISVTPYLGYAIWDTDLQLDDGLVFGGRAAVHFLKWLSLEGTYGYNSSSHIGTETDVTMTHLGADLVAELLPSSRFNPYLTAGWAQLNYDPDGGDVQHLNGWEVGVGAKIRLGGDNASYRALRIDVREVVSDLSSDFANYDQGSKHSIMATVGFQFAFGKSSKDTDNDGVRDKNDACPDTPAGAVIDESGCPVDSDGDGVFDGLDQCSGTVSGAIVGASGCPTDRDGDGVFDGLDKCSGTLAGAKVDASGCPLDSDGDGVYDGLDKCPNTESKYEVDAHGCPVPVSAMEEELLDTGRISTSNIVFNTSSSDLNMNDIQTLREIGEALAGWPKLRVEIGGFTDSSGSEAFNQKLSEKRALSVLDYLTANFPGINTSQFTAVGYGEANPVADNSTSEGRKANRRVEFKVLNTEVMKRTLK